MKKIPKEILFIVFILLLVLVAVLGFKIYKLKKETKKEIKANIVVPIVKEKSKVEFNINIDKLKKNNTGVYYIKVVNYNDKKVLNKDTKYNINFNYTDNMELEVYKDEKLIKETPNIEKIKLNKNKKETHMYKINIKAKKDIKNGYIVVKINN